LPTACCFLELFTSSSTCGHTRESPKKRSSAETTSESMSGSPLVERGWAMACCCCGCCAFGVFGDVGDV